ncbi:MAG: putative hydrolase of the superfamily [Acidimicrobiaceae bacterium]|jgi:putative hydrolase of the HAD superfamily|nr:putative hydrolase of the superfamily [Acidimicrobiaceae bacterium]
MPFDLIAFDADDTLWHSEGVFVVSQEMFRSLLQPYLDNGVDLDARLAATERRNLAHFGYGVKGFTLSMIETAIEVTDGRVSAREIGELVERGKVMMAHPVELLDGVAETLTALASRYHLALISKGDLLHQEQKLARSGLAELFDDIEIVSEKDEATYRRVLQRFGVEPSRFLMVGNSVRSDILPVLAVGGNAVHIPYEHLWAHEHVEGHVEVPTLPSMRELPAWLDDERRR